MARRIMIAAGVAMLGVLAGCSDKTPQEQPEQSNEATPAPAPAPKKAAPAPAPETPIENATTNVAASEPEPPVAPDVQMLDDADATGLTARVSRDSGNESAVPPVQESGNQ
jgi:uncharacterized lipoprotein